MASSKESQMDQAAAVALAQLATSPVRAKAKRRQTSGSPKAKRTPTKPHQHAQPQGTQESGEHVMTVFDKGINLMAVSENTTLYSAARAWMSGDVAGDTLRTTEGIDTGVASVITLPRPKPSQVPLPIVQKQPAPTPDMLAAIDQALDNALTNSVESRQLLYQHIQRGKQSKRMLVSMYLHYPELCMHSSPMCFLSPVSEFYLLVS
eukprot:m.175766 g.175766  ORF g.175766 m.175766 type:complete len:206 (-) comp14622_c1_seq1:359-976(-)